MPISQTELRALRHPSEAGRFLLTICVLIPVALLATVLIIGSFGVVLLLVPLVLVSLWLSLKLWTAHFINNSVKVTPTSFPEAYRAIEEAKALFGYEKRIDAFVYQDGNYNAALMPLLNRKFLFLNSEVMKAENGPDEVRFLVGRFVGALASRHFRFFWFQGFLDGVEKLVVLNMLLKPYERAVCLSGDQMGLYMINGDISCAVSAMMKLIVGVDVAERANVASFLEQEGEGAGSFFVWLSRAMSSFPHHTSRVANLIRFAEKRYPDKAAVFRRIVLDAPVSGSFAKAAE